MCFPQTVEVFGYTSRIELAPIMDTLDSSLKLSILIWINRGRTNRKPPSKFERETNKKYYGIQKARSTYLSPYST